MNRLNARGKTSFITIRRRGSRVLRDLANQPNSAWRRTVIDTPKRRHRNIRYLEQIIQVADYEGDLRQIAVTGLGRDKPTLLLTNNRDETARQIMTRYTSRNGIEDSLGSGVNFFHLDCLASEVPLNVDLDAALTVVANGCYRWLASELDGFTEAKPKRLCRKIIETGRDGSRHRRADPRPLPEAGAQPDLEASGARRQSRSDPLGRWQDPPLHLRRDGLTRPKSVSRFPSAIFGVGMDDCESRIPNSETPKSPGFSPAGIRRFVDPESILGGMPQSRGHRTPARPLGDEDMSNSSTRAPLTKDLPTW